MKSIQECYPELWEQDSDDWWAPCNYQPILDSFGYKILIQVDDSDYQGDSRVLYRDGDRYGYLQFGWGSCSGCDALQACSSVGEVESLQHQLHRAIRWFGSKDECLKFFQDHDWEGEYSWHEDGQREFIQKVICLLGA